MKNVLLLVVFFFAGLCAAQAQSCKPNPSCTPNPACQVVCSKAGTEKAAAATNTSGQFFTVPVANTAAEPAKASNCEPANCKIQNCDPSKCVPIGCEKPTGKKA